MDFAELGFKVDSQPLTKAATNLDKLAVSGAKADKSQKGLSATSTKAAQSTSRLATEAEKAAAAEARMALGAANVSGSTKAASASVLSMAGSTSKLNAAMRSNTTRQLGLQLSQVSQQAMAGGGLLRSLAIQLPDIGLAFGTVGIAAGVLGGLLLPLIGNFIGLGDEGADLEEQLGGISDALDAQSAALDLAGLSTAELDAKYGAFSGTIKNTLDLLADVANTEAQRQIDGLSDSLSDLLGTGGDGESRTTLADFFDVGLVAGFTAAQREARGIARELTSEFQAAQMVLASSNGDLDGQITALQSMLSTASELAVAKDGISDEEAELINQLGDALNLMVQQKETLVSVDGAVESVNTKIARQHQLYADTLAMSGAAIADANALLDSLSGQNELQAAINEHGRDSAEVAALKADAARDEFDEMLANLGVTQDLKDELIGAFQTSQDLAAAAGAITFDTAVSGAAQLAEQLGISHSIAASILAMTSTARSGVSGPDGAVQQVRSEHSLADTAPGRTINGLHGVVGTLSISARTPATRSGGGGSSRSSGGGGSSRKSEAQREAEKQRNDDLRAAESILNSLMTPMDEYNDALDQAKRLLDAGVLPLGAYNEHLEQLGLELNEARFEGINREIDTLSSSFGSAVGEMESFKDLWGSLGDIAENSLRRIASAWATNGLEGILNGVLNIGGGSTGGGFTDFVGSLFSFDGGGFTGSGSRSGGVDGMGGFPAILHPNETVIDHTKGQSIGGGGQQNVAVHVTVSMDENGNLQAMVDQRADQRIGQAAPAIQQGATQQTLGHMASTTEGWG